MACLSHHQQHDDHHRPPCWRRILQALTLTTTTMLAGAAADATWSIILIDTETKEIVVGSATCLSFFDLKVGTPVLLVEVGAATAQSYVDTSGRNRELIWTELIRGTDPLVILDLLEQQDPAHQTRQYGIVDTLGRPATFTGTGAGAWAGGLTGQAGTMVYAIQGNVLTGEPVVLEAERAVLNTPGGLPEKLMAGMEAAMMMGGDGRCSCSPQDPTGCGSPPEEFEKSAHIAYMLGARPGDTDGFCGREEGCATGDYYMDFNLAFQNSNDPDPVIQLREMFDEWRAGLIGRPDGVKSIASLDSTTLPPDYVSTTTLTFELRDWQGNPINVPIESVDVEHKRFSDGVSRIGEVEDLGAGRYGVEITTGICSGVDMFAVQVDDGIRPVEMAPAPTLTIAPAPESFQLADPTPGIAGQVNTLVASNSQPGNTVRFVYGRTAGLTQTPCGPIAIADPVIAGDAIVDANGDASLARMVSQGARRQRYYFQAVDIDTCERTNVSCFRFE